MWSCEVLNEMNMSDMLEADIGIALEKQIIGRRQKLIRFTASG